MKILMALLFIFFFFTSSFLPVAFARWGTKEDATVVLESSHDQILVHADASYEIESETILVVQKEAGIDTLKLVRIPYDPNTSQLTVVSASTINGANVTAIPPTQIEDKDVASQKDGLGKMRVVTIPFPALQVGSKISYKTKRHQNPPFVPGLFQMAFSMARQFFTISDVSEIRSEIPLAVKHKGASDIVNIEDGKEGPLYKVKISLLRPTLRIPLGEGHAAIHEDTLPRIEVGAAQKDWGDITKVIAPKLETAFQEQLPAEFQAIVSEVANIPSVREKAKTTIAKLIEKVKYLGDWRTEQGYYLPRSLAEIARTKQGDCKDFSFSTVAMLRKLGIKANVAWVHRGPEDSLVGYLSGSNRAFDPLLPGMSHFNHAIVAAELDGKLYWLDPTNPVAHVGAPFDDIADRAALILDSGLSQLSRIPKAADRSMQTITSYMAFRPRGKADVMTEIRLEGAGTNELERQRARLPEETKKLILLSIVPFGSHPSYPGVVTEIDQEVKLPVGDSEVREQFTYVLEAKGTKTSLGNSFQVPKPGPLHALSTGAGGRVTGIVLGEPGVYENKLYLANFELQGEQPRDYQIQSSWARLSRKFDRQPGGMIITDRVENLFGEIPLNDANGKAFEDFQKEIQACFDDPLLIYKWKYPEPYKPGFVSFPNPLVRNRGKLYSRAEIIEEETAQNYERLTYSKMLLYEQMQSIAKTPSDIAEAIGLAALITQRQGYISHKEYVPEDKAEREYLTELALKIDPDEPVSIVHLGFNALEEKGFQSATEFAERALRKKPLMGSAHELKFQVLLSRPASPVLREATLNKVVRDANELLLKKDLTCKLCILGTLQDAYFAFGKKEEIEKVHLKLIEISPKSSWALLNFALFLNQLGRYEDGAKYARKAIDVASVGMAHLQLSWALSGLAIAEIARDPVSPKGISLCEEALEHFRRNRNCLIALSLAYDSLAKVKSDSHLAELSKQYMAANQQVAKTENGGPGVPLLSSKDVMWVDPTSPEIGKGGSGYPAGPGRFPASEQAPKMGPGAK